MTTDRRPRLADVYPGLVADIVRALRLEGPKSASFAETFQELLFYGPCPDHGPPCLVTAPPGTPCPAMTEVELDGETLAMFHLDVDDTAKMSITHVEVLDGRELDPPA
ncbi:hypothetical protein [Actinomadura sp. DC4]|uniref:hypothetical protein n=1 Tax=Actinomadura sp. DC4 TaxID=3055069 RepID=UPI0025AF6629|nr:hypothetical protein [Actinomadura sp. DC4]MDN3352905.1 hypothetical protein [Actinomadura sp. DC4]